MEAITVLTLLSETAQHKPLTVPRNGKGILSQLLEKIIRKFYPILNSCDIMIMKKAEFGLKDQPLSAWSTT
jgi:hypothetical protein